MDRWLTAGDQLARAFVAPALALVLRSAPRLGRGTRPMPIDLRVQDEVRHAQLQTAPRMTPVRSSAPRAAAHAI